jgi:hypothetical protein
MSSGPLSNPSPSSSVNAYDEDPDVQRPMDGSAAQAAAAKFRSDGGHQTPDHKAGAGTAIENALPDRRSGQDRHPTTGQYQ